MTTLSYTLNLTEKVLQLLRPQSILANSLRFTENNWEFEGNKIHLRDKVNIFACGKAASFELDAMRAHLKSFQPNVELGKMLSYTKLGHSLDTQQFNQIEGDHPYISVENIKQSKIFVDHLQSVPANESLIFLLSGGASALLENPIEQCDVDQLFKIHKELVNSGLNINSINNIRKQISKLKNGGLLNYIKSESLVQFVTCDIPNEDLFSVGSSPLLFKEIIDNKAKKYLENLGFKTKNEKPKIPNPTTHMLMSGQKLLAQMQPDKKPFVFDGPLGELIDYHLANLPKEGSFCLSGGEAYFNLPEEHGRGGRSTHFVLSMAKALYKSPSNRNFKIMSFGTDGTDGPTDAAGAFIDYPMFTKLDCDDYLTDANSYEYFNKIDGLIKTGPTQTNVMDIRCIWNE